MNERLFRQEDGIHASFLAEVRECSKMKIAISGKGGTGKTTVSGTLARIFSEEGYKVLAVDGDPSMNLHTSIGTASPMPVSKLRDIITERTVISPGIYNLNPRVEDIPEKYASKKDNVKLIVMGTVEKGGEGCVCPENAFLRALMRHLVLKRDELLILDTEAGVEHLGRKTAEGFDLMLILCEPSTKAVETANRIYALARQIGVKEIYAVGNKITSKEQEKFISENLKFGVLGFIPFDEEIVKSDLANKPLIDYGSSSEALKTIKGIAAKMANLDKINIVKALLKPEAYDEKVEKIELMQTHISFIFLTGKYVYKVKKPVNFGFLDFTTLEKRKFYCEEEVRVNRPLCGDMYIGVVPINKQDGIKINGPGETIEYAVKMRQLPQEAIMMLLLKKNEVTEKNIDDIARLLADFHAKARTGEGVDEYGGTAQIRANWIQNFEQTRNLRGSLINKKVFDFVEANVLKFMEREVKLFEARVAKGKIRECHGDVHSGNIFIALVPKERRHDSVRKTGIHTIFLTKVRRSCARSLGANAEIYIFDAIEFNKAFSCSDVAAEVAFLAMDLEFHDKRELANFFVKQYMRYSGDSQIPKLLPFYKCYRAYVRAKVASFRLGDANVGKRDKKEAERLTEHYFDLAYGYARELLTPAHFCPQD